MQRYLPFMLCGASLLTADAAAAAEPDAKGVAFFETNIRPVLVAHCYTCHGDTKQKGGLRLDSKASVLKGGAHGPALVAGKAEQSLLIRALSHKDEELKMPPKEPLPATVVADFARWIDMGAPDPRDKAVAGKIDLQQGRKFWSFQPPQKPALPAVKHGAWVKTPIDQFVLAGLEARNLQPVQPADRHAWMRRATFDLTGLPPTPSEVEAFLADHSPEAYEHVIDRLLQSPHYGERWGRYWLDGARYAEDQASNAGPALTNAWRYRDWVVAALNADMPYDRFIKEQLAADLLETDAAERLKQLPALGFLGLSPQYATAPRGKNELDLAKETDERIDTVSSVFLGLTVACARCHDHKYDPIPTKDYYSLAGVFYSSSVTDIPLASTEQINRFAEHQRRVKDIDNERKNLVRLEEERLKVEEAGRIARTLQAAWKYQVRRQENAKWSIRDQAEQDGLYPEPLERWLAFLESKPDPDALAISPPEVPALAAWLQLPRAGKLPAEETVAEASQSFQKYCEALLAQTSKSPNDKVAVRVLVRLRGDGSVRGTPFALLAVTQKELDVRMSADVKRKREQLLVELTDLQKNPPSAPPLAHGLKEGIVADAKVFLGGDPITKGEVTPRRFLRVLAGDEPPLFKQGSGRLELAEAIASKGNPLTARVMVNRIWQHHFGRGLVGTPSNFGQLGERPTHPELLDYLACRFVESGWSIKALHRDIMRSAVYQLGVSADDRNLASDGDNRFLWRMDRQRLDIEAWRDALLAVSGELDPKLGGASGDLTSANNRRRTMYAKVSRVELNALLRLFDFPVADVTSDRRTETTVPQQQLFVLNSPFMIDRAKALAARLQAEAGVDGDRVRRAFSLVYGRPATEAELKLATEFLAGQDSADERSRIRLSRWERLAQALLAGNEFLYLD